MPVISTEEKKISLKGEVYQTLNSGKYIGKIRELLTNQNIVREDSLFKVFNTSGQRIGVKAYLRCLEIRGVAKEKSDEQGTYYQFLEVSGPEKPEPQEKPTHNKTEYPTELQKLMKGNKIKESDIDNVFTTRNDRRSIKLFIIKNYINKGLAKKIADSSGPYYQFDKPETLTG